MEDADEHFLGHTSEDGRTQPLREHLENVAGLARGFALHFDAEELAFTIGLLHDLGKYSARFQSRIRGASISVDHATAGAQYLCSSNISILEIIASYCILGHHAGLPDGGCEGDNPDTSTFCARLKKNIEDYSAFSGELEPRPLAPPKFNPTPGYEGFSLAVLTRMLFSCLVDADWLDTEHFMSGGKIQRGNFKELPNLLSDLENHVGQFASPTREIDEKRSELLSDCFVKAQSNPGLFTLTAPTGSGKTISSMAFALTHAVRNGQQRVIYAIPYNTIIEQNAHVFEDMFGAENVVQHHSGIEYENSEDSPEYRKLLATENWDGPIIVTSNVQFFESLLGSKTGKCRKLHNIANSVIVFDEAQMIPVSHLLPCIAIIKELVLHYHCTIVLATATQPSLNAYFEDLPQTKQITEIAHDPSGLYEFFRRVSFESREEPIDEAVLAAELDTHDQVLCVVNTRKRAQSLCERLQGDVFHLSTTMYPKHRSRVLDEIRRRLSSGERCRVVSTSLIEAGVDVDFPALYREKSGLDSIIQAAGRCNREGRQSREESKVVIFTFGDEPPQFISLNTAAFEYAASRYEDIASLEAIEAYFEKLRYYIGREGLDKKATIGQFDNGYKTFSWPFKTAASEFKLIEDDSRSIIIPVAEEAKSLISRLRSGERSRALFRKLQQYSVSLYSNDMRRLEDYRAVEKLDESISVLSEPYYSERYGVTLSPRGGEGIYI
jgi:CRISPR-associated endonuclease/helicase Cas3